MSMTLAAEIETEFPESRARQQFSGTRTILATPLLREDIAIGAICDSPNGSSSILR